MTSNSNMLETDFPLVLPPITNPGASRISRSSSRDRNSLNRPYSVGVSMQGSSVSPAPEWQYEAVSTASSAGAGAPRTNGSMSRIQTSFQPSPQRPIIIQSRPNTHLNRSSSLRKAYSDDSSSSGCDDHRAPPVPVLCDERQPLNPIVKQPVALQSSTQSSSAATTSDYHSDGSGKRPARHVYPDAHDEVQSRLLGQNYSTKVSSRLFVKRLMFGIRDGNRSNLKNCDFHVFHVFFPN